MLRGDCQSPRRLTGVASAATESKPPSSPALVVFWFFQTSGLQYLFVVRVELGAPAFGLLEHKIPHADIGNYGRDHSLVYRV